MRPDKTIQAWTTLNETEPVWFSLPVWLEAAERLKPGELLRAKVDHKGGIIPVRLKRPPFFRGIWARIKNDPWFKEHRISLRNTEACVLELMNYLEGKREQEALHTSLHLLRSFTEDRELTHQIGKRKVQVFQCRVLHELMDRLAPHIDFQGEKELLEKQALYALASSNVGLFKKMKKDARFPLIRSEMLTIDHIKNQREWHKKRIKKIESFIRHLSRVSESCIAYKKAFRSLIEYAEHSKALDQEDICELKSCFDDYEAAQAQLFGLSELYDDILSPQITKLNQRELDHLVSRFALSFEKAAAPVLTYLRQLSDVELRLTDVLRLFQKDTDCVQQWWASLDDDFKRMATPWKTKEVPLCTHLTKQFRPCEPVLKYLEQYLNELLGLKLIMQKGCLAEKSLAQCTKTLFQMNRLSRLESGSYPRPAAVAVEHDQN